MTNFTDDTVHSLSDVINTSSETSMCSTNRSHPGTTINVSAFKPKCYKRFQFLAFLLTNIRGGFASKLDEFQALFNDNNIDIAVLTETWLHSDINSDMLHIPGYSLFRIDRRDGRHLC